MRKALLRGSLRQTTYCSCLPENRGVVCTWKSEFLPLKDLPCASSLQQQDPQQHPASSPSPRTRTEAKNPPAFLLITNTSASSAEFAGLSLITPFRNTPQNLEFAGPRLQVLFEITKAFQEQAGWVIQLCQQAGGTAFLHYLL